MAKINTILEEIKGLTLLEASQLVKMLEEKFGVSAAAAHGGGGWRRRRRQLRLRCGREDGIHGRSHRRGRATRSTSSRWFAKSPASA